MASHIVNRFDFETICAGIIRLIKNPQIIDRYAKFIDADYFFQNDNNPEVSALRAITDLVLKERQKGSGETISIDSMDALIKNSDTDESKGEQKRKFFKGWISNPAILNKVNDDICFNQFLDYLKLIQVARISKDYSNLYQVGEINEASKLMQETLSSMDEISKPLTETFSGRDLISFLNNKIDNEFDGLRLGSDLIDDNLGQFGKQTLNLFISVTGGGKSMMAHHILRRCIQEKKYVHIFCCEDKSESFIYKITACLTKIPIKRLRSTRFDSMSREDQALIVQASKDIEEYIKVDFIYGQNVDTVHKVALDYDLECSIKKKPVPTVNIVDYTGHIASKSHGDSAYERIRNAYASRKDFALKHHKICFDFAQVNRMGNKSMHEDKLLSQSDLAGAYDLSQVCDNIISINRSALNISNHTANLFICKARDGVVGFSVTVGINFASARYEMEKSEWHIPTAEVAMEAKANVNKNS